MKSIIYVPSENPPVTLPRVFGVEVGRGYVTVEYQHEEDGRGMHMRRLVKRRKVRRASRCVSSAA